MTHQMTHRHLQMSGWNAMTIESLFDDGRLEDWQAFADALRGDEHLARETLRVLQAPTDEGAGALALFVSRRLWPNLLVM